MIGASAPLGAGERQLRDAHRKRASHAWNEREMWNQALYDVYNYVMPVRQSKRLGNRSPSSRADMIFDATGQRSVLRGVNRIIKEFFTGEWFKLALGPAADDAEDDQKNEAALQAEQLSKLLARVFDRTEFGIALKESLIDAFISTGAMMLLKGDRERPVRFVNASFDEIALDLGPYRDISGIFWKRPWTYRAIKDAFPDGEFDANFDQALLTNAEAEVVLCQDTVFDYTQNHWRSVAYLENSEQGYIWQDIAKTRPWVLPRMMTLPGQVYGYGLVMIALPTIKALNKATELQLRGGAIAMAGIYTQVDDGVFNPDLARIEPGAMWKVAANGGVRGPSIQKLPPPGDLNLGNIVLGDLRGQVQSILEDQQLPPDGQTPRSAIEIAERIKRAAMDQSGDDVLLGEIALPCVERALELLHHFGLVDAHYKIDGFSLKLELTSPKALAMRASPVTAIVNWLQMIQMMDPTLLHTMTPLDQTLAEIGADIGVPAHVINSAAQRGKITQANIAAQQAQAQALAQSQAQAPAPSGAPMQPGLQQPPGLPPPAQMQQANGGAQGNI